MGVKNSWKGWMTILTMLAILHCSSPHAFGVTINEIRITQSGTDRDEYFELAGSAGEPLNNLTYLVIGDYGTNSGVIEEVTDLNGWSLSSDGLFLAAESTFTLGSYDMEVDLNFENSDNVTHMLVSGFTGSVDDDLDAADDGFLDDSPWTSIIDSVALLEKAKSGDQVYSSTTVGPNGANVPAHVYRVTDEWGSWRVGSLDLVGTDSPGRTNVSATPVPEPSTLFLLGSALAGFTLIRKRGKIRSFSN